MELESLIRRLEHFPAVVSAALSHLPREDACWRSEEKGWSLLEIANHLADEEREDFATRMRLTLEDPSAPWPPIDPEGDVDRRGYNQRDLAETLERFAAARAETVDWLRSLEDPDWNREHELPLELRAGDLLASLVAHDALHLRQIARRLFDLGARDTAGFETRYAGSW